MEDQKESRAAQLALFPGWFATDPNESRTLDIYDALPRFVFNHCRDLAPTEGKPRSFNVKVKGNDIQVVLAAADVKRGPKWVRVFSGPREELVERALRQIAAQDASKTELQINADGQRTITVRFSFSEIRRILAEYGHSFKISEINEALDVLSRTSMSLHSESLDGFQGHSGTLISNYSYRIRKNDQDGSHSYGRADLHALATRSILTLAWFPINNRRVMALSSPLARWLSTRMYHNFRQVIKNGRVLNQGYHIALSTIIEESALIQQERPAKAARTVVTALEEMRASRILSPHEPCPRADKLGKAPDARGRPQIVDVIWTLFPSNEVAEEIIQGNLQMKNLRCDQAHLSLFAQKALKEGATSEITGKMEVESAAHP